MATDDVQRLVTGTAPAPATFKVPGNGQIRPKAIFASYNGSGAGGPFVPALKITSDAGKLVGIYPVDSSVAAGASADVSWFPRVGGAQSSRNPVVANELDYVEIAATVNASTGTQASPVVIIQGNAVTYDGATRVRIEAFSGHFDLSAPAGGNFLINLFLDSSNLGRFGILNTDTNNTDLGVPYYGVRYMTPAAGSHAFSIRGWTTGGTTINFEAGPGGSAATDLPGYLRVST